MSTCVRIDVVALVLKNYLRARVDVDITLHPERRPLHKKQLSDFRGRYVAVKLLREAGRTRRNAQVVHLARRQVRHVEAADMGIVHQFDEKPDVELQLVAEIRGILRDVLVNPAYLLVLPEIGLIKLVRVVIVHLGPEIEHNPLSALEALWHPVLPLVVKVGV